MPFGLLGELDFFESHHELWKIKSFGPCDSNGRFSGELLCRNSKQPLMSTFRQIFYQIVFGTKYRKPTIASEHEIELYKYISAIIKNKNCKLYRINGIEDHIHIMSDLHPPLFVLVIT